MAIDNYRLYHLFDAPTESGSVKAIAVTYPVGKWLQSFYGIMLQTIVLELWALVVLAGMAYSLRRKQRSHSHDVANIAVWNLQSSPVAVVRSLIFDGPNTSSYAFIWIFLAVVTALGGIGLGSSVSPYLIVSRDGFGVAPVNEARIYIPSPSQNYTAYPANIRMAATKSMSALTAPAAYRAVSALDAVDPTTGELVTPDTVAKGVLFDDFRDDQMFWISWNYSLTGYDFGMQKASQLRHNVQGRCVTEYSWYQSTGSGGNISSYRWQFPTSSSFTTQNVTSDLSAFRLSVLLEEPDSSVQSNVSFALIPSTAGRISYVQSFDPWYFTASTPSTQNTQTGNVSVYEVLPGRPALSCWQQDLWIYDGVTTSIWDLKNITSISPAIRAILMVNLGAPRLATLAQTLNPIPLKSSLNALGGFFDGSTASIAEDVKRLVRGAYVATRDVLQESTLTGVLLPSPDGNLPLLPIENAVLDVTSQQLLPGADEFVIQGRNFISLRLSMLAIVPTILVAMHIFALIIGGCAQIPWPWREVHAMDATVLYRNIVKPSNQVNERDAVEGDGLLPSAEKGAEETIVVRPVWDRRTSSFSWHRMSSRPDLTSPTESPPIRTHSTPILNDSNLHISESPANVNPPRQST